MLARLARELIVGDGQHVPTVLKRYGLDPAELDALKTNNAFFAAALQAAAIEWNSALNTKQRCEVASAWYLEQLLPHLTARALDPEEVLNAKNETAKTLARIAGFTDKPQGQGQGERITINIDMGDGKVVTIEGGEAPSGTGEIQALAQGPGDGSALRRLPEGE